MVASPAAAGEEHMDRMASVSVPHGGPPIESVPRGLARLHRDAWRTLTSAPLIFVAFPVVASVVFDLVAPQLIANVSLPPRSSDLGAVLISGLQETLMESAAGFVFEAWIVSVLLAAARLLASTGGAEVRAALRLGTAAMFDILKTTWSVAWRVVLGTVCFVVPGVFLSVRYSLALPVTAFEGVSGPAALRESIRHVDGQAWRLFGYAVALGLTYMFAAQLPAMGLAIAGFEPNFVVETLLGIPAAGASSLFTIAAVLVYCDAKQLQDPLSTLPFAEPIGLRRAADGAAGRVSLSSGGIGLVAAISIGVLAAVVNGYMLLSGRAGGQSTPTSITSETASEGAPLPSSDFNGPDAGEAIRP